MEEVLFEATNGVAVITINRPEARNAVNLAVAQGIARAIDALDARPDLRVGILTGAGGTFCAGMDLKAFARGEVGKLAGRGFAGLTQAPPCKPLLAAVEGFAVGGGFELALACDLIVASSAARFGLPEVKRGLVANAGGLLRLPRQLPHRLALELVLTGSLVEPDWLLHHGLINRVTPPGGALDAALRLAREIATNAPLALQTSKRVINDAADWSTAEMFERQAHHTQPVFQSKDAQEGARAFAEKRTPVWSGT